MSCGTLLTYAQDFRSVRATTPCATISGGFPLAHDHEMNIHKDLVGMRSIAPLFAKAKEEKVKVKSKLKIKI